MIDVLDGIKWGHKIVIFWPDGEVFKCTVDTISESFNDLEMDDPGYFEYYMVTVKVEEIVSMPPDKSLAFYGDVKVGSLLEVSLMREPLKIESEDGTLLWQRGDNDGWKLVR